MRLLSYETQGGQLPPHTDFSRTDYRGMQSTHTFLLYMTDCTEGGETLLLRSVQPLMDGSGGSSNNVVAAVKPQRGTLLLFPHRCPHAGAPVVDVPKRLVRGELY